MCQSQQVVINQPSKQSANPAFEFNELSPEANVWLDAGPLGQQEVVRLAQGMALLADQVGQGEGR